MEGDDTIVKVKTIVFKSRIRLKEFFSDFDKLRCGNVTQTQFKSGLSMAGLQLSAEEMDTLVMMFSDNGRINYREFCAVIDDVFGKTDLEKTPTLGVPSRPQGLVKHDRFTTMTVTGGGLPETMGLDGYMAGMLENLKYHCKTKRIMVKPFFDDASRNQNSPLLVNHVSKQQFKQALKNHIAPDMSEDDVALLTDSFAGEGKFNDMVNYVAFANTIDPSPPIYDPYTLRQIPDHMLPKHT